MSAPATCSAVTWDMKGTGYGDPPYEADLGDLLWNPKSGDGHVLVRVARCGIDKIGHGKYAHLKADCGCGGWGTQPCPSSTLVCECGQDGSWRDHHYVVLARRDRDADTAWLEALAPETNEKQDSSSESNTE